MTTSDSVSESDSERDRLFEAARSGDAEQLAAMLDEDPSRLNPRMPPYDWTLLHAAAHSGKLDIVDLLLDRGLDVNTRENGDNTTAMHWAAAAGHLDVVQRLADAGGDVIGKGDDHELQVIGWATCWDGCDDDAHRAIVDLLLSRGAKHHIFSALAVNSADEVRRIVREDPAAPSLQMSRNENHQRPLHFAVRMNRPEMVETLLELGADPNGTDASGYRPAAYATSPAADRALLAALRERGEADLLTAVALEDWDLASMLLRENSDRINAGDGVLHLMAKRNHLAGVNWLLAHGADPNGRWDHWGALVTPLHLAALNGHAGVVKALLDAGADPSIRDTMHDGDAMAWASVAGQDEVMQVLRPDFTTG